MSKLDFTNISDKELLELEKNEDSAIGKKLIKMIYDPELGEHYEKLEEIKQEKDRRNLDG